MPKHLVLEADYEGIPLTADGSDIIAVRCYMTNNDGNTVPLSGDNHPIKSTVSGEGSLIGDGEIGANPIITEEIVPKRVIVIRTVAESDSSD